MKKILIIENSPKIIETLKDILKNEGYSAISAATGEEGVKKAKSEKPDLVIIDTLLPDIDGFEACRQIKQDQGLDTQKIIVMTDSIDAIDAVKARHAGADDYCIKTKDFSVLVEAVRRLL